MNICIYIVICFQHMNKFRVGQVISMEKPMILSLLALNDQPTLNSYFEHCRQSISTLLKGTVDMKGYLKIQVYIQLLTIAQVVKTNPLLWSKLMINILKASSFLFISNNQHYIEIIIVYLIFSHVPHRHHYQHILNFHSERVRKENPNHHRCMVQKFQQI